MSTPATSQASQYSSARQAASDATKEKDRPRESRTGDGPSAFQRSLTRAPTQPTTALPVQPVAGKLKPQAPTLLPDQSTPTFPPGTLPGPTAQPMSRAGDLPPSIVGVGESLYGAGPLHAPARHSDPKHDSSLAAMLLNGGGAELSSAGMPDGFVTRARESGEREQRHSNDKPSSGSDSIDGGVQSVGQAAPTPTANHLHQLAAPEQSGRHIEPPAALVQRLVEFATVHRNNQGVVEFTLGLQQSVLGGMRIQLSAYGNRRVGLTVKSAGQHAAVGDEELAGLIDSLRRKNVEVVEVVRA
jgi:hypothetical protein